MAKNLVVCCDGTGNQIEENLSNVLKLFRVVRKNAEQCVFYDPGVGTLALRDTWAEARQDTKTALGLATGYGLDENVLSAYRFLIENYKANDNIYLFGFSRGAYTARVLGALLHTIGLLKPEQKNLCDYALGAYKQAGESHDLKVAWHFQRVSSARPVTIKFLGVWDTVSSVLVPRKDRFFIPSLQKLPYTRRNPSVEVFRHAMAIDERRRMFRLNRWNQKQEFVANPFTKNRSDVEQDVKQVWFSGVHSDVGGGYPEKESALSKYPLQWLLQEATDQGLRINTAMMNHLILGHERSGSHHDYMAPDPAGKVHNSMSGFWPILEWIPKNAKLKEWPDRKTWLGMYLPKSEPRFIEEGARIHWSVFERKRLVSSYQPPNLPKSYEIEGKAPEDDTLTDDTRGDDTRGES